jgi:hypothetical protein
MPISRQRRTLLLSLPLAAVLVTSLGACAHERLHHDLNALHEDFHSQPHTRAEHRRLHEDLNALHEDEHDRGYYGGRAYGRDSYYRGGY